MPAKCKFETKPKGRRRNSEKRKEKSREAARSRRGQETEFFSDLASMLPLPGKLTSQMDKASIMRLTISYLKMQSYLAAGNAIMEPTMYDPLYLKALDGFVLVLSLKGNIDFVSGNVSGLVGLSQIDMIGRSIYDYCHPYDHAEVEEALELKSKTEESRACSFVMRIKSTLSNTGRSINLKSASYKVVQCFGNVVNCTASADDSSDSSSGVTENCEPCLVAIVKPIPDPSNIQIPLDKQTFLSKHSLDGKYTYVDDSVTKFLGYAPSDLLGHSSYGFHHAIDNDVIQKSYKTLFSKGQCETGQYRYLAKGGGYATIVTQATLIYENKGKKPQSIVCVNFIVSGIENQDEILSACQIDKSSVPEILTIKPEPEVQVKYSLAVQIVSEDSQYRKETIDESKPEEDKSDAVIALPLSNSNYNLAEKEDSIPDKTNENCFIPVEDHLWYREDLQNTNNQSLFVPRTADMNHGFLMFTDDENGYTLVDDAEDLTHLAPTAGDVCVPIQIPDFNPDLFDNEGFFVNTPDMFPFIEGLRFNCAQPLNNLTRVNALNEMTADPMLSTCGETDTGSKKRKVTQGKGSIYKRRGKTLGKLNTVAEQYKRTDQRVFTEDGKFLEDINQSPTMAEVLQPSYKYESDKEMLWTSTWDVGPLPSPPESNGSDDDRLGNSSSSSLAQLLQGNTIYNIDGSRRTKTNSSKSRENGCIEGGPFDSGEYAVTNGKGRQRKRSHQSSELPSSFKRNRKSLDKQEQSPFLSPATSPYSGCESNNSIGSTPNITSSDNKGGGLLNTYDDSSQSSSQKGLPYSYYTNEETSKDSVLLNLLISGCDQNSGYICRDINKRNGSLCGGEMTPPSPPTSSSSLSVPSSPHSMIPKTTPALMDPTLIGLPCMCRLTQQDYEVNAPSYTDHLLQGNDLLVALEIMDAINTVG